MKRKKGIPLVALIIFIALLVAIILTCVIILGTNKDKINTQPENMATNQTPEETNTTKVDEKGEEITSEDLINSDQDIASAYKLAGNKKNFAKYAIYESGGFDKDNENIKNELKLILAMAQVTNSDMNKESSTKSVSKDKVQEYADKIFEDSNIEFKDFSLYDSDTNFTDKYKTIGYTYNKTTANYEVQENDVEEDTPPEVTEVITKAVKYSDKIEIYVKPIFIQPFFSEEINANGCQLLSDYDFQMKEFPEDAGLKAFSYSDYENALRTTANQDIDGYVYNSISKYVDLNQIQDYKYTFTKVDGEFKLKAFEKIENKNANNTDDKNTEMTEQEKSKYNAEIESFVGSEQSASDVKKLLETIIKLNSENAEKNVISIKLDADEEDGKDGEAVQSLEEKIDETKTYNVKATYKSRLITTVTIKANEENQPENA